MKKLSNKELKEVLRLHALWLKGSSNGVRADLAGVDFRGANFREVKLIGANFRGANLEGADFRGANLEGADFRGANLRKVNLREVNLIGADFEWADLTEADFREADLTEADFRRADLTGANFEGAGIRGADFDYSAWQLSCNTLHVGKCDDRLVIQLLYHTLRLAEKSDGELSKKLLEIETVKNIANNFHRVKECGEIK